MITGAYAFVFARCDEPRCVNSVRVELNAHPVSIGLFEMLTPDYVVDQVHEQTNWQVSEDGSARCPKHRR